jgi:hypothetical protein
MYQVERMKFHCVSKMWDMVSEEMWPHFYDGKFRLTAHNCRTSACLSRNTHTWLGGCMHR